MEQVADGRVTSATVLGGLETQVTLLEQPALHGIEPESVFVVGSIGLSGPHSASQLNITMQEALMQEIARELDVPVDAVDITAIVDNSLDPAFPVSAQVRIDASASRNTSVTPGEVADRLAHIVDEPVIVSR